MLESTSRLDRAASQSSIASNSDVLVENVMPANPSPTPSECPVCGSKNLEPSLRQSLGSEQLSNNPITGILSYRCHNGHVFMPPDSQAP